MENGGVIFYISEQLQASPNITHAITTRHGGVSPAPYHSLNLSAYVGDEPANARENLARVHRALGLKASATVDAKQAQAVQVARITEAERGTRIMNVDALISNIPNTPLMLRYADCVPILFYDPVHRAIGVAHAGWRGTVGKVVTNTVCAMGETFGTKPEDLIACIGPSIGPCCYEIGADVQSRVEETFADSSALLLRRSGSTHLDLWEANAAQLRELGVRTVEVSGICTSDRTDDFYSWRREQAHTGRFAAIIALND